MQLLLLLHTIESLHKADYHESSLAAFIKRCSPLRFQSAGSSLIKPIYLCNGGLKN